MNIDGKIVSISSVNFSKASFMQNREAGVMFAGDTEELAAFTTQVFEFDWDQAFDLSVTQTYTSTEMKVIQDKTEVPVVIPEPYYIKDAYVTPTPTAISLASTDNVTVFTSPDYARTQILDDIRSVTKSFDIMIYQVRSFSLCHLTTGAHFQLV